MPAILNIEACEHTYKAVVFESPILGLEIEGSYDWITITSLGIDPISGEESYSVQVLPNAPLGTHEVQLNPGSEYITIVVDDCAVHVNGCIGLFGDSGALPPPPGEEATWTVFVPDDSYNVYVFFNEETQTLSWLFTEAGSYFITLLSNFDPNDYLIYEFEIDNCFEDINPCDFAGSDASYPLNIAWFNRDGGWENYVFMSRKTYQKRIGDVVDYKAVGLIKKRQSISDVHNGRRVPSGLLPLTHLNKVEEMDYTIQAFVYNDVTENWDIPILIDLGSFDVKEEGNGYYTYNFSFIYAEELKVQSQ